ncbi:hypothetical protein ACIPY5_11200 [Microbacterium sp. NPDC089698]|uniref:hypothetical protein n=1 Tax=Microbacterium sp. NPDC089698 TaxID=3364200 RepID=UPI00382E4B01
MTNQLILERTRAGSDTLKMEPADDRCPQEFEDPSQNRRVPRLGSYDLVRLARFAKNHNYEIDVFRGLGRDGSALNDDEAETLTRALMPLIDDLPAIAAALSSTWVGYVITSVQLTSPTLHQLRIWRMGRVDTDDPGEAKETLQAAVTSLRLA